MKSGLATAPQVVLVVEDEPLIRLGLASTLEDEGYQVLEASNASEAVRALERHPEIEFVITDVNMPGAMDGVELARSVRARDPAVHLIIVSGARNVSGDDLPDRAVFLSKPYQDLTLLRTMARMSM
jgi:CheY-like chemotaxis protein